MIVPAAEAAVSTTLFIKNPVGDGKGGVCFTVEDQGIDGRTITPKSARVAVWDRQDNPSFQTLADWGATWTPFENAAAVAATICVPGVLSDHCNRPGPMTIFIKLRDVTRPSRTTSTLPWYATCPRQ